MTVIEKQYMDSVININRMMRKAQDSEPDWEQRRYEIAKDMMTVLIKNPDVAASVACGPKPTEGVPVTLAKISLEFADALVAGLKKTQEKK